MEKIIDDIKKPKNVYEMRIRGVADIPKSLDIDKRYFVAFPVICKSIEKTKSNLESDVYICKCEISGSGTIQNPDGEKMPTKDKRSMSKRLRDRLWIKWNQSNKELDEETFYQREMERIISEVDNA